MRFADVKNKLISQLSGLYSHKESAIIAQHLFSFLTKKPYEQIHSMDSSTVLAEKDVLLLDTYIKQLSNGMPFQYVIEEAFFDKSLFRVTPDVLIPRPETEELVERVSSFVARAGNDSLRCIDIGTGSGCIAISLKKRHPKVEMTAVDVSRDALCIAQENARTLAVDIDFVHEDISSYLPLHKVDIIVSNPPYITHEEKETLTVQVLDYEPHLALFEPPHLPMYYYACIADWSKKYMEKKGILFLEIHEAKAKEAVQLFHEKGFSNVIVHQDMNEKDRFVEVTNQ